MQVQSINKNGWHFFEENLYGFLEPRPTEALMPYGSVNEAESMFIDVHGDLMYLIDGVGWEAEQFRLLHTEDETMLANAQEACYKLKQYLPKPETVHVKWSTRYPPNHFQCRCR